MLIIFCSCLMFVCLFLFVYFVFFHFFFGWNFCVCLVFDASQNEKQVFQFERSKIWLRVKFGNLEFWVLFFCLWNYLLTTKNGVKWLLEFRLIWFCFDGVFNLMSNTNLLMAFIHSIFYCIFLLKICFFNFLMINKFVRCDSH